MSIIQEDTANDTSIKPRLKRVDIFSVEKAIRVVVLLGCVIGFLMIVLDQCWKFYLKERTTASRYATSTELTLPIVMFCPTRSFNSSHAPQEISITQEVFDQHAQDVRVDYHSFGTQEFGREPEEAKGKWNTVYTVYNGRCRTFTLDQRTVPSRKYAQFHLDASQGPVAVFLLRDQIEALFVATMAWISDIPSAVIQTDTFMTLDHSISEFMNLSERPCATDVSLKAFGTCLAQELALHLEAQGHNCTPIHFEPYFQAQQWPQCQNGSEIGEILKLGQKFLVQGVRGNLTSPCWRQCSTNHVHPMITPMTSDRDFLSAASKDNNSVWSFALGFNSDTTRILREMYLYDTADIVAAIGGALGMFLGWSCYQNYIIIRNIAKKRMDSPRGAISKY